MRMCVCSIRSYRSRPLDGEGLAINIKLPLAVVQQDLGVLRLDLSIESPLHDQTN